MSYLVPFKSYGDFHLIFTNWFAGWTYVSIVEKMTPTMVIFNSCFIFFFLLFFSTVRLDATNSFPSNTTYLSENRPHHEKTCFCHMWTTKAQICLRIHTVWSAPLLFAAWIVTRFYSAKLYSSIGITYLQLVSLRKASYRYIHLFMSKFHPEGTVLHRFCFPVSIFFW